MDTISVIMPVYNGERHLQETIDSILNQTYRNFELLMINDGSTDNTLEIMESYEDNRIRIFNQKNKGITPSLNRGIKNARGKYIGRIDCGDIALENRFEKQINLLEKNEEIYGVGSWALIIDEKGKRKGVIKYPTSYEKIKDTIIKYNPFIHPSMVFRKKLFKKAGLYDESFEYAQDTEFFLRTLPKYKIVNIPEILLKYKVSSDSISQKKMKKQRICHLRAKLRAISRYNYPVWNIIYFVKPFVTFFIPTPLKKKFIVNFLTS